VKKREIFIELTSLLDVILIMLFVLLSQTKLAADDARESVEAAENSVVMMQQELEAHQSALADARAENDALTERIEEYRREEITLGVVEENSLIITLSVKPGDSRYILVESRDGAKESILIDSEDENYSQNKLRATLNNLVHQAGTDTVFVVFQYDRGSIYQSEYQLISNLVRELKSEAKTADIHMNYIETDIIT
jgi:biopolymer transport protein ExbD